MKLQTLCLWLAGLLSCSAAHAIDAGTAQGTLTVSGDSIALTRSFAHLHQRGSGAAAVKELRILLTEREVAQAAIAGAAPLPLQNLKQIERLQAVLLRVDPRNNKILGVNLLHPMSAAHETAATPKVAAGIAFGKLAIGGNRVLGDIAAQIDADPDQGLPRFEFKASFSAPLFRDVKAGAAKQPL